MYSKYLARFLSRMNINILQRCNSRKTFLCLMRQKRIGCANYLRISQMYSICSKEIQCHYWSYRFWSFIYASERNWVRKKCSVLKKLRIWSQQVLRKMFYLFECYNEPIRIQPIFTSFLYSRSITIFQIIHICPGIVFFKKSAFFRLFKVKMAQINYI